MTENKGTEPEGQSEDASPQPTAIPSATVEPTWVVRIDLRNANGKLKTEHRVSYEVDLNDDHASDLREALADYIAAARRTGGRRRTATRPGGGRSAGTSESSADRLQNRVMREWAREHGYEISERGRVPNDVKDAYERRGAA